MYPVMGMDLAYIGLVVISTVLGLFTQSYIKSSYKKWSGVPASTGETGAQVAQRMLNAEGASDVGIVPVAGTLTDHYDPRDNKLHLSQDNLYGGSVASVAVACHEAGHAVQNATGYRPMQIRTAMVPVVSLASNTWMIALIAGIMLNIAGLVTAALVLFAASVAFHLVTLPVEFDASRRAVKYIERSGLDAQALKGAKQVLTAAALTYVASALVSVLQFLYYYSRFQRRRS